MDILIFGTGQVANKILQRHSLRKGNVIIGVFDNDVEKQGKEFAVTGKCGQLNWVIQNPVNIAKLVYDFIVIAVGNGGFPSIKAQLLTMGVSEHKIILSSDLAEAAYLPSRLDFIFEINKKTPKPFSRKPAEIYRHYEGETTRCKARREREGFFERYCQGDGLDVGYGGDIITPTAAGWDLRNGDAQYLQGVADESFDFVYSSHCIEHMLNVRVALKNWFRVVKPGGYLLLYIPHRDLYEKRIQLPSLFNPDHKHMFLIGRSELPDTLDIVEEISRSLQGFDIQYVKTCDCGYIKNEAGVQAHGEYSIELVVRKLLEK